VLEVIWTALPVVILVGIAIPSFRLLYHADVLPQAEMTVKAVGHQWYWSYEYPDHGGFGFDSVMVPDNEIKQGQLRLLEVDNRIVLPVDTTIRIVTTSVDVLHAWAVPALGLKTDSVPGRLNEMWVKIEKPGMYYGQCSELCGNNHGFMPIQVEAVSKEQFARWIEEAKRKFASSMPASDERVAAR
jgi:cytochrome c oxidase subunit 2